MDATPASTLVLNPDELGSDPASGMDLAMKLGIGHLEIRSAEGANAVTLPADRLRHIRALADERGLKVAALASPLWKWCRPEARPGRVDTFGFPTQVPPEARLSWVERAIEAARILGAPVVRVFWRRTYATAGGVLHQQAIHGLALALRLLPGDVEAVEAEVVHCRGLAETEDHVTAAITLAGGATVHVDARVDHDGPPAHELVLHLADGRRLDARGRNLEAGLGEIAAAPTHETLRRAMYAAVLAAADGRPTHPCLFPLTALRRPLEVIDCVYRDARVVRAAHAAAA